MSRLRTRSSPGKLEGSGNNASNSNLSDHNENVKIRKNSPRTILKMGLLIVFVGVSIVFAFFLGTWREKQIQSVENSKKIESKKTKLLVNWRGTDEINKEGDLDGDACILLSKSFSSKHFAPDPVNFPDNPLKACHKTLKNILKGFDNGFFYEGDRLVGFISGDPFNAADFSVVNLYNVCVRSEERGKGFAKAMVPEFVRQVIEKRVTKRPKQPIYIGLDVDFSTETPVAAFALYAKMGFNRWWEPCSSINDFDFSVLKRQHDLANPPESSEPQRPSVIFPMSQLFLRRSKTYGNQLLDDKGQVRKHFCMVMAWGVDDFGSIGTEMKEIVQSALLLESKK